MIDFENYKILTNKLEDILLPENSIMVDKLKILFEALDEKNFNNNNDLFSNNDLFLKFMEHDSFSKEAENKLKDVLLRTWVTGFLKNKKTHGLNCVFNNKFKLFSSDENKKWFFEEILFEYGEYFQDYIEKNKYEKIKVKNHIDDETNLLSALLYYGHYKLCLDIFPKQPTKEFLHEAIFFLSEESVLNNKTKTRNELKKDIYLLMKKIFEHIDVNDKIEILYANEKQKKYNFKKQDVEIRKKIIKNKELNIVSIDIIKLFLKNNLSDNSVCCGAWDYLEKIKNNNKNLLNVFAEQLNQKTQSPVSINYLKKVFSFLQQPFSKQEQEENIYKILKTMLGELVKKSDKKDVSLKNLKDVYDYYQSQKNYNQYNYSNKIFLNNPSDELEQNNQFCAQILKAWWLIFNQKCETNFEQFIELLKKYTEEHHKYLYNQNIDFLKIIKTHAPDNIVKKFEDIEQKLKSVKNQEQHKEILLLELTLMNAQQNTKNKVRI
jgi:hypothetical protein